MSTATQGRERLERTLVLLSRQAARSRPAPPPRGRAARQARQAEQPHRPGIAAEGSSPVAVPFHEAWSAGDFATDTASPAGAAPAAEAPGPAASTSPAETAAGPYVVELPELDELLERLDRLEGMLEHLSPHRPVPATRDVFMEWVRVRRWEEMPFGEFLTLRRAGKI
jgi:hypothetical protein